VQWGGLGIVYVSKNAKRNEMVCPSVFVCVGVGVGVCVRVVLGLRLFVSVCVSLRVHIHSYHSTTPLGDPLCAHAFTSM